MACLPYAHKHSVAPLEWSYRAMVVGLLVPCCCLLVHVLFVGRRRTVVARSPRSYPHTPTREWMNPVS